MKPKKEKLNNSDVNLCLVGTYSSGKSTFINALIGKRILPESINSETAKMFRIKNAKEPAVSFIIKKGGEENKDKSIIANIVWDEEKKKFAFHADGECEITREKVNSEVNSAIMFRLQQHEQLYQVLKKLNDIGVANRGFLLRRSENNTRYNDGSLADYYSIVRRGVVSRIPSVIIEHGYITSS
mgnify:CR=1 FL=1